MDAGAGRTHRAAPSPDGTVSASHAAFPGALRAVRAGVGGIVAGVMWKRPYALPRRRAGGGGPGGVLHFAPGGWEECGGRPRQRAAMGACWLGRARRTGPRSARPAHPAAAAAAAASSSSCTGAGRRGPPCTVPVARSPGCCRGVATTWRGARGGGGPGGVLHIAPGGGRNVRRPGGRAAMGACWLGRARRTGPRSVRPAHPASSSSSCTGAGRRGFPARPAAHRPGSPFARLLPGGGNSLERGPPRRTSPAAGRRARARKRGGAAIAAPPPVLRPTRVSPVPPGAGEIGGCSGVTP